MKCLLLSVSALVCIQAVLSDSLMGFEEFKALYNKTYDSKTEEYRLGVFLNNSHFIKMHNQEYAEGKFTYTLKQNQFADLTFQEFVDLVCGFKQSNTYLKHELLDDVHGNFFIPPANVELPEAVDWRDSGAVTPVKDQGGCGSCWSFSATGAIEGQQFRKTGQLQSLSEQNLIDCSRTYKNYGCGGGLMTRAFDYVIDNKGIDTEDSYPYEGKDGKTCRFDSKNIGAVITKYTNIKAGSEEDLKSAVATVGPISIAIYASPRFQLFSGDGIFYDPDCSSINLNHGVLAVGYGENSNGEKYWLVKNSWGTNWANEGYVQMARDRDNNCGVATMATYPLL